MAEVNVTVNGRSYRMACDDGQEEHLEQLGARLDQAIVELRGAFGEIGDQRLTVMAAILMTDRLHETEERLSAAEKELKSLKASGGRDAQLARALDRAAARIEELTDSLNAAPGGDEAASDPYPA
ncbi:MAG TPA: cell division protein ZapA [Afifellaceae bacterium]|nr:cell division protein ZapA [Afifellaceae bacterium]